MKITTLTEKKAMNEKFVEARLFNKADLEYFEASIQAEIEQLSKEVTQLTGRLTQRREMLSKIRQLRSNGDFPKSEHDFDAIIPEILKMADQPLRLKVILENYITKTKNEIKKPVLFEYLQKNKGTKYEVVGERGAAKWRLTKSDNQ